MSPSRARRGDESTTLQHSNEAPRRAALVAVTDLLLHVCPCVPRCAHRTRRDVPMKNVASLHGHRIRTAVRDIIVAFEPNTRAEGPLARALVRRCCCCLFLFVCFVVYGLLPRAPVRVRTSPSVLRDCVMTQVYDEQLD